ncbi:Frag1/DRAM/Sfk1 family-domain-containing protein [Elsinoe ampelina]|uniref:Frag1/DRAM/Sfk1 family-domain-containing protein n=1 Tax=Elsinoe ampelina TaxID=302913 RepID=A0A6A6G992_9PEZI|nr:Frag1/DRAM/Sfk1 family-domain-containing protein [Elsinoe ampelina]
MAFGISYYIFPLISAFVWTGTLMAMLIYWAAVGKPIYPSQSQGQSIAFISDVGAQLLKPLFIAGSAVTVVSFDLVFINEQWLRHKGRLAPATSKSERILGILASVASIAGGAGLILLSIFDTLRYPRVHRAMLAVFIVGYLLTAIFVCAEYQRLGIHQRQYRILRASFWIKLSWCLLFLGLAIAFVVTQTLDMWNTAAIIEWVIGFLFAFFVASFAVDFLPAMRTRSKEKRFTTIGQMEQGQVAGQPGYSSDGSFGSHRPMAQVDGRHYNQGTASAHIPSRNF